MLITKKENFLMYNEKLSVSEERIVCELIAKNEPPKPKR
jgi:hypothetical protein